MVRLRVPALECGSRAAAFALLRSPDPLGHPAYGPCPASRATRAGHTGCLDKLFAKIGSGRAPEALLDALALGGGFAGGWAGMFLFRHKTNYRKHAGIWLWLVLATLGHGVLAVVLLARA